MADRIRPVISIPGGQPLQQPAMSLTFGQPLLSGAELLPQPCRDVMGLAEWFGESVAAEAAQHQIARTGEISQMPGRDEDRLDLVTAAEYFSDLFATEVERGVLATFQLQGLVLAAQSTLGTAHRGNFETQSQMAGKTQLARMCQALTITEEDFWWSLQQPVGR